MGKTLSLDLRERVLAFIVEGHSCHEAARRFRISAASAVRIIPTALVVDRFGPLSGSD